MLFSPFSALRQNIAATMAALSLTHSDEAAFQTWLYSSWIDSGFVTHFAVLSQPASSTKIQFDVRVGVSGRKVNVWWGDGTSNSYTPGTSSDTACSKTYGSAAVRPVVVVGSVKEFRSSYSDGRTAFGGMVQGFRTELTLINVHGSNTLSGSVAGCTLLTYLSVGGSNGLSGSVAGLTLLTYLSVTGSNTISGPVAGLTRLTYLAVTGSNTISGPVAGLTQLTNLSVTGSNTLSGPVAGLTLLTILYVGGSNTISGPVAGLTRLTYLAVTGSNTLSGWGSLAASATGLCQMTHGGLTVLDATEVNAVLAGFWANRDAAKSSTGRAIDLGKDTPTPDAAPTGQGLIDKAALEAYRSPNNDPTKALWTVTTN